MFLVMHGLFSFHACVFACHACVGPRCLSCLVMHIFSRRAFLDRDACFLRAMLVLPCDALLDRHACEFSRHACICLHTMPMFSCDALFSFRACVFVCRACVCLSLRDA